MMKSGLFKHSIHGRLLVLLLVGSVCSMPGAIRAQESENESVHALHPGAWALQFGIGDNISLEPFQGNTLSIKKHFSTAGALQAGLTVGTELTETAQTDTSGSFSNRSNRERATLTLRYLSYPMIDPMGVEAVEPFFGVGPLVTYEHTGDKSIVDGEQQFRRSTSSWGVGLSGSLGAEWFVHRRIGLHAAYATSIRYERHSGESQVMDEDVVEAPTRNLFTIGAGGVQFGASVYF